MAKKTNLLDALFADVQREAAKRKKADSLLQKATALRGMLMGIQVDLEADPSKFIAVRAARRTGKSTGVMFIVTIRCLEQLDSEWVVIGLTRASVKRIYWGPLQKLNDAFELGIKFQHQEMIARFPNGSKIYFVGADSAGEVEKLRGGQYNGVIIDECKSYAPLLFVELVEDVLTPALLDRNGQMYLIGTPGDVLEGPFYLATAEQPIVIEGEDGSKRLSNSPYGSRPELPLLWSLHAWSLKDNTTRFRDARTGREETLWDRALAMKADRGLADTNPFWRREFLGLWVANEAKKVYRYFTWRHDYTPLADTRWGLPADIAADPTLRTVIGVDPGSKDGTAMVVWAWSPYSKGLWEVYSERRLSTPDNPLNVAVIARWYRELDAEFGPFEGSPMDPAGLATMVSETLSVEHGIHLEIAEKREKNDFIELFNTDLDAGLIHIRKGSELSDELITDRWLAKTVGTDKRKEDPAVPNDVADAALYAFRWARHRQSRPAEKQAQMYSQEWWAQVVKAELAAAEAKARAAHDEAPADREWWHDAN